MNRNSDHASDAKSMRVWFEIHLRPEVGFFSVGDAGKRAVKAVIDYYDINLNMLLVNLEKRQLTIRSTLRAGKLLGMQSDDYCMWKDLGLRFVMMDCRVDMDEIVIEFIISKCFRSSYPARFVDG